MICLVFIHFFKYTFSFLSITVAVLRHPPPPNQDSKTIDKIGLKYFTAYRYCDKTNVYSSCIALYFNRNDTYKSLCCFSFNFMISLCKMDITLFALVVMVI